MERISDCTIHPPRTATRFRHAAQAWARCGLAWGLRPPAHRPPWTPAGSRQGEATRSNPAEPLQGSRFTGLGVIQHPREALAALGIPGLHAASLMGLWDSSPLPHPNAG